MKILTCGDIHHRHEALTAALLKFENEGYDKFVQIGDLFDSFDRSNEDGLRCLKICLDAKEVHGDNVILLHGNHHGHYIFANQQCSGFRPDLYFQLNPILLANQGAFQVAYQEGNYLWTHAGVQRKWYNKHKVVIESFEGTLADQLNGIYQTHYYELLFEVGTLRGGLRYNYGGPLWCDKTEMESYGPIKDFHQICGHTPIPFIEKIDKFEGGKHYNNTSVTFCDVLKDGKEPRFLTIEI